VVALPAWNPGVTWLHHTSVSFCVHIYLIQVVHGAILRELPRFCSVWLQRTWDSQVLCAAEFCGDIVHQECLGLSREG
jgi:hypothetical protein